MSSSFLWHHHHQNHDQHHHYHHNHHHHHLWAAGSCCWCLWKGIFTWCHRILGPTFLHNAVLNVHTRCFLILVLPAVLCVVLDFSPLCILKCTRCFLILVLPAVLCVVCCAVLCLTFLHCAFSPGATQSSVTCWLRFQIWDRPKIILATDDHPSRYISYNPVSFYGTRRQTLFNLIQGKKISWLGRNCNTIIGHILFHLKSIRWGSGQGDVG